MNRFVKETESHSSYITAGTLFEMTDFSLADAVFLWLLIVWLHCVFASCCRWCTTEKSWTIHSGSLITVISSFGRSTWMHRSSSWTWPPAMSLCFEARDHRYLACVSMMHRVSKVGCFASFMPHSSVLLNPDRESSCLSFKTEPLCNECPGFFLSFIPQSVQCDVFTYMPIGVRFHGIKAHTDQQWQTLWNHSGLHSVK